jgi:hypothetical protein
MRFRKSVKKHNAIGTPNHIYRQSVKVLEEVKSPLIEINQKMKSDNLLGSGK